MNAWTDLHEKVRALQIENERLRAALRDAVEGMADMRPYVEDYFAEKWGHDAYIARARAALGEKL